MRNPKVTVLMSVYNGEKYLKEAIDSILNQTFSDFEFIIINDGSTDNTLQILKKYKDSRIIIINNSKNIGLTKSLNIGIKKTRGEYIARMDADDISLSNRLNEEVIFLENNNKCAVVGTFIKMINEKSKIIGIEEKPITNKKIKKLLVVDNCIIHGSTMIRKKCLEEVGHYDESFVRSQDYDLWLRMSEKYELANIPKYLYVWRKNRDSIESRFMNDQKRYVKLAKEKKIKRSNILKRLFFSLKFF